VALEHPDKATQVAPTTGRLAAVAEVVLVGLVVRLCQPVLTTGQTATAVPASAILCAQALSNATLVAVAVRVSQVWAAAAPLMAGEQELAVTVPVVLPIRAAAAVVAVDRDALA
jgi:hypothetical protein